MLVTKVASRNSKELAIALCAGCVLSIGFSVFLHVTFGVREAYSTQLLLAAIVATALVTIADATLSAIRRDVHSRVLIVGSGNLVDRITTYFNLTKGVEVVGRVVDATTNEDGSLGTVEDLPQLCDKFGANRIIVAFPTVLSHDSITILRSLPRSVHIAIVPRYFELISWRSRITDLYGLPLVEVAPAHFSGWDRFVKRGFDVIAGSLLHSRPMPSSFDPLRPGQAQLTRDQSSFDRSVWDVGVNRSRFTSSGQWLLARPSEPMNWRPTCNKPRSHSTNSETSLWTSNASRALAASCAARAWMSYLNFSMSCGGTCHSSVHGHSPRCESETFTGWQARRFELRPGITGLWQVSGRNDLSMDDLRRLDYLYVASWSLWWDVKIVWDTPRAMVRGFGAY